MRYYKWCGGMIKSGMPFFGLGYNINIVKSLSSVIEWLMWFVKKKSNMIMCSSHKQWVHLEADYGNVALVL